jgi:serine phosphatase RsbU (regulator of sigma subunit)
LEEANEVLCTHTPPSMFVTCFYGVLDLEGGHLRYANAGHDLPYSRRHDGMADELRVRGMPLGLMPSMGYEEKEALLAPEECVLFYSDGLLEAHNPKGEMFGSPRPRNLVTEHPGDGKALTAFLLAFLLRELQRFVGDGWEQEDDFSEVGGLLEASHDVGVCVLASS